MRRIFFINQNNCEEFFKEVKRNLEVKSWKKLAKLIGTNKSMIDNYRKRILCLPEDRFNVLLNQLNESRKQYFLRLIEKRNSNWGQIIGGKKAYNINKKEFDIGRKNRLNQVKYNFDININLSEDLCEFIGAFIGDGFTNKYRYSYQTQITGDNLLDSDYYYNRLKPFCERLFKIPPKITQKGGWIRLTIYSKRIFELLTKRFNFPEGKKSSSIFIPSEIYDGKEQLLNSTLRGMFDTDGGIGLDKRKSYKTPYIRINYTSNSGKLINQIHHTLLKYHIEHSIHNKEKTIMIQINGKENVRKYMSKIGFSNKRHLDKIKRFL